MACRTLRSCSTQRWLLHQLYSVAAGDKLDLFFIPLTALGWTGYPGGEQNGVIPVTDAEFASVMGSIANIAIEADWHTGDDNTGLDNVVLASGGTPAVPDPRPGR